MTIRGFARLAMAVACLGTALTMVASASATSGTLVITTSTTLSEDHHGTIVLAADDIVLDGAGNTVFGDGTGDGISVTGRRGVTVRNVRVTGFIQGIAVVDSQRVAVTSNHAFENPGNGIFVLRSRN